MIDDADWARLGRYLAGECTPQEAEATRRWLEADPERAKLAIAARDAWTRSAGLPRTWDTDLLWRRFSARAGALAERSRYPAQTPAILSHLRASAYPAPRRWIARLTAAAIVGVLGVGLWRGVSDRAASRVAAIANPGPTTREIATAKGQRATLQLGDGSHVTLGVDSRLRFSSTFGQSSRELYLEGRAYFDVVHDSTRPFRVRTSNGLTEDVGTKFTVTAYPEQRATQVVVAEGAVTLAPASSATNSAKPTLLIAGMLGEIAGDALGAAYRAVDPRPYQAWMANSLVFRAVPLRDVIAELRRWYDVDLRLGDQSLADIPLTASFTNESFDRAMNVVTTVLRLRIVRSGNEVRLVRSNASDGNENNPR